MSSTLLNGSPASGRRPRVEVRPSGIAGSYGEEACDLARLAGVEPDPWQEDGVDLALSYDADRKWSCFEYAEWASRQNGKGTIFEIIGLASMFLLEERLTMWSAHLYSTAQEAFLRMDQLIRQLVERGVIAPGVVKPTYTNGEQGFLRTDTRQRIKFHARSKGGGRGWSGDRVLIDEAFAFTPEQQAAIMPTMSARPNPQIVYASTPPLAGDEAQVMYSLRERAESGKATSLGYRDWGRAGQLEHLDGIDLDDREVWRAANPALGIRIAEDFVERERAAMSSQDFARERLGIWPARITGGGAIDIGRWADLLDAESRREGDVACAVDISPLRDYASVCIYGVRADGKGHGQVVRYHPGTDWIVPAMVEVERKLKPVAWGMGTGTYKSLREELLSKAAIGLSEDTERPARGDVCVVSGSDMAAACGQLVDAIKQGSLRHVGDAPLEGAVRGAKLRQVGDVIAWARKESSADISPLVALTLARWAYLTRIDAVRNDYVAVNNIW